MIKIVPGLLIVMAITIICATYQNTHPPSSNARVVVVEQPAVTPGHSSSSAISASYTAPLPGEYKCSGPYSHANLMFYLVHGPDTIKSSLLTLQEALEQGKVIVSETGNVNELTIQNISATEEVFVQSGDIVKGGRQDRVMANDFIVPKSSGAKPISSFCVESGRWTRRGHEEASKFNSSTEQSPGKSMKLATKQKAAQADVWSSVSEHQEKLKNTLSTEVRAPESASSYQLTLENQAVKDTAEDYIKSLSGIVNGKDDVIGFVFAINGKLDDADIYASHELFLKLWPKLLKSAAVEAIAEFQNGRFDPIPENELRAFLKGPEAAPPVEKIVDERVKVMTKETDKDILFESFDNEHKESSIHKSYIRK
jgi:hypothetical protein